ncbi:MAG: M20 family metallopeptidase [Chloroflexi bacterium]|nr:M20 family metallopeptidase [Chloroflexota bacterium]
MVLANLHSTIEGSLSDFLADLAELVNQDCGSYNKTGVDSAGEWISDRALAWGWAVQRLPVEKYGDCWIIRMRGDGRGRLMLSGHLDTVYPDGTAAERPMRREGSRILGPGTCDMKAGLLAGMYAMRALQQTGFSAFEEISFFFNSDEEIGSLVSRTLYAPVAAECDAVFVLEAARANGDIVSARKGGGLFRIHVDGKAAHAGVEPEKGANALLELSHQIIAAQALNGIAPGVSVSVGVAAGGHRSNVVPDHAWAQVDVRATTPAGADAIERALRALPERTTVPGTKVTVSGDFGAPPMPKSAAAGWLVEQAQAIARDLGFTVKDASTGGVSDANMMAGLGVPVIDGLGPVGGLDHGPDEYIDADSIVPRTTLLAEMICRTVAGRERLSTLRGRA